MTHTVLHILKVQVWLGPHTFFSPSFFSLETRAQVLKLRSFNASGNNCPAACQKWRYRALPRKYR